MTLNEMKEMASNNNGKLPAYAWPGGYPITYLDSDNCTLCAGCATKSLSDPDENDRFRPVAYDVYYEGPTVQCEQCNIEIESAYGDPAVESEEGNG